MARVLKRLPGRKILLTNAPASYAHHVLRHLGLHRHFADHLPIESMVVHRQLRPKPSRLLLRRLLAREGISARRCVLVEDTLENLRPARRLGMRTVWISRSLRYPRWLDLRLPVLRGLPRAAAARGWLGSERSHGMPGANETP